MLLGLFSQFCQDVKCSVNCRASFSVTPEKEPQGAHVSQVHSEHATQLLYSQNLLLLFPSHAQRLAALGEGVAVQTGGGACRVSHGLITHLPEKEIIIIFHSKQLRLCCWVLSYRSS